MKTMSETMDDVERFGLNSENRPIKERLLDAIRKPDFDSFKNELFSYYENSKTFLNELLLISCESSDKGEFVENLLSRGDVDVNYYNETEKKAPVHLAVMNGCEYILRLLLNHPQIDVNILDGDKNSPLHLAAIAGSIECTTLLLNCNDIKPNQLNKDEQSPMHLAFKSNKDETLMILYIRCPRVNLDIVQELIDVEEVLKNHPKVVPLHYLFRKSEDDFISLLTAENLVNLINGGDGFSTYLQIACSRHLPKVVRALLKHGANPNGITPHNDEYPLFIASYNGFADIVKIFLDTKNPEIIYQMNKKNTEDVTKDNDWYTSALHEVIRGSDVNCSMCPEFCNYDKTFELLLKVIVDSATLDINYINAGKMNCLHLAGCTNNQNYVHSLLDSGAYIGDCGTYLGKTYGESPLSDINYTVLESYLNKCVGENQNLTKSDLNYSIKCTYKFLCPPKVKKSDSNGRQIQFEEQSNGLQNIPEIDPLLMISNIPELKALLLHPVLIAFFHLKWSKIQKYYYLDLIFYVGFLFCLTSYTLCSKYNESLYCSNVDYLKVPLLLYLIYLMMRESYQIIYFRFRYIKYFENWLEISLILSTSILIYENGFKEIRDSIYVIAILISWIELMFIMSKWHTFAVQFAMFKVIFENFFHLLRWYSVLIIAFILSFYIVVKDDKENESKDIYSVSFKTIVMLGGELNVDDKSGLSTMVVGRISIILFIFLVSIVLVNTLNGLAVGDIEKVQKDAEIIALESRMYLIHVLELFLINIWFNTDMYCFRFCRIVTKWLDIKVTVFPDALRNPTIDIYPNQNNLVEFNLSTNTHQKGCVSIIQTYWTFIRSTQTLNLDNECVLRAKAILKSNNAIESKKKEKFKTVFTKCIHELKELLTTERKKQNNEENMNIINKAIDEIKEIIMQDEKYTLEKNILMYSLKTLKK